MPRSYHTKVGERFGSRIITGFLKPRDSDGHLRCRWKCDCGNKGTAGLKAFRHASKCPRCRARNQKGRPTHGHSRENGGRTSLYNIWAGMMQRTRSPTSFRHRKWYFDKGITVCDEWQSFEGFLAWASTSGYKPGLSIDRIFTCRGYEPKNCEWVTRSENSRRAAQDAWRRCDNAPIEMLWGET